MYSRRILSWLLMLSGAFLMLAFLAAMLPVATMSSVNDLLGLEELPIQPITIYLARSTSLLYGVHGVLMFYTGWNLERHMQFASLFGWLHILIGVSMLTIDLLAPMPWYWTMLEGAPVALLGVLILYLAKISQQQTVSESDFSDYSEH